MIFSRKFRTALAVILIVGVLTVILSAKPVYADGLYLGIEGGIGWTADSDIDGTGIDTSVDFETGSVFGLSLGYVFADGIRGELELANRWSDADSIGSTSSSGDMTALSAMVNGFFDFHMDGAFTPYVGAGIGAAQVEANGLSPVGATSINDKDTVLAYQVMAGVAFPLNDAFSLTADYRYFGTDDLSYSAADGTSVDQEYANQSIMLGIRFDMSAGTSAMPQVDAEMPETTMTLAQTPEIQEAAPEPQATTEPQDTGETAADSAATQTAAVPAFPQFPRAYRILFDWNEAQLTNAGFDIIRQAAENAQNGNITRIEATGHTDTSGNKPFNMELSRKRAEAVLQALLNLGLTDEQIVIHWHGETQPLLATGDNVRELQNRRVEIIFADN